MPLFLIRRTTEFFSGAPKKQTKKKQSRFALVAQLLCEKEQKKTDYIIIALKMFLISYLS